MRAPKCINVESRFPRYQLGYEDPLFQGTRDPWHKVIECRSGHICPAGGSRLWACTKSRTNKPSRMFLRPEVFGLGWAKTKFRIVQDGDDGLNVEFDVKDWKEVFKMMGAKR